MKYGFKIRQKDNGRVVSESGCLYDTATEAETAGEILLVRAHPMVPLEKRIETWKVEVHNNLSR